MARVHPGEWVAGVGAFALLVSLFGPWEHRQLSNPALVESRNGWLVLGPLAVAAVAVAAVPLWQVARRFRGERGFRPMANVVAGTAGVALVLAELGFRMGEAVVPGGGLDLGLVAAGVVAFGGALGVWFTPRPRAPGEPGVGGRPRLDSGDAQRSRARTLRGRGAGRKAGPADPGDEAGRGSSSHDPEPPVAGPAGMRAAVPLAALRA